MGWSFRSSRKFGPLRVNLSRSGIGASVGVRGARVGVGPRGTYVSFGAGGFSYRANLSGNRRSRSGAPLSPSAPVVRSSTPGAIETASVDVLASVTPDAVLEEINKRAGRLNWFRAYAWMTGPFLLLMLGSPPAFVGCLILFGVPGYFLYCWNRDRRTARIVYDVDNEEIVGRLAIANSAGEALARASALWHVTAEAASADVKYSAGAGTLIARTPTRCAAGSLSGIELNVEPWAIPVGPQQLLLLPDRLLVRQGKAFASLPYDALLVDVETTQFVEAGRVPKDSQVVAQTWQFVNRSGGPDLCFKDNRQLPVAAYGQLTIRSSGGLQIVLQASNPAAAHGAAVALQELGRISRSGAVAPGQSLPRSATSTPAISAWSPPAAPPPPSARGNLAPPVSAKSPPNLPPAPPPSRLVPTPPRPPGPPGPVAPTPHPPVPSVPRVELTQPRHFRGVNQPVTVAGWTIRDPITYVSGTAAAADASTIITSYSVGSNPHRAAQLPYWPSYAQADADQRARYLEWMAGGRQGIDIEIGYVFIFFYGLEWRALRDRADADLILHELRRLYDIHAARSGSFGRYAADFVAFVIADRLENLNEHEIEGALGWLVEESSTALSVILAWYCLKQRPLPVSYAMAVAATMEDAARSVVTKRSPKELADLFRARYQERFGHGLVLVGAKRSLALEYSPASPTLLRSGGHPMVRVPNVLGRKSQIGPLVNIWNQCVEDLRKLSTLKQKHGGELTPASWAALPPELRAQYDHPAQEQWDAAVRAAPRLGPFHLLTFGSLASILGIQGAAKLSAAQVRNVAETAAELDYAMEPDGRVGRSGARLGDDVLVWRATDVSCPNPELYRPVRALLALTTSVALADGALADEELHVVITMLTNLFALDEGFRARVVALQHLLARKPASATAVAKKLQAKRTREEMVKVGRVLVAVAGADGEISEREEHVLGSLYKALGLSKADLAGAIASSGARLASDAVAEVQKGSRRGKGEAIPPPPSQTSAVELDQAAIASILADTREVAAMLAEVLDQDEEEPASKELRTPPPAPVAAHPGVILPIAKGLDIRYHGILGELLTRSQWSKEDARALSARCQLMPGAVVETINAWSDEVHGDFLIDDSDGWLVRADLLKEQSA